MSAEQSFHIRSNRLDIEIAAPGSFYRGARFDWTGFITQVTLDEKHTFCAPEDPDPGKGTGGAGLCGEFGIELAVGYAEAAPGESFPKLGIGLLRRPDQAPYQFNRSYEIASLFPVKIDQGVDWIRFSVEPLDCNGYAARTTKTIRADANCLEILERLENLGAKPIATQEYYHNFIALDGQPLGPEYRLHFPYPIQFIDPTESYRDLLPGILRRITPTFVLRKILTRMMDPGILAAQGRELSLKTKPQNMFYARLGGFSRAAQPQWELQHVPSGLTLREYDDFTPWRVAVWGAPHVISAEVFIDLQVAPGEAQQWTRRYEFFA